jgi:hypothetical protein
MDKIAIVFTLSEGESIYYIINDYYIIVFGKIKGRRCGCVIFDVIQLFFCSTRDSVHRVRRPRAFIQKPFLGGLAGWL